MSAPQKKNKVTTEVDDWGRRKFKLEEVEEVEDKEAKEDAPRNKSMLVGRQEGIDIEKYVGRVDKKKSKKKEVFFCQVCNEGFTVDMALITHLNSPQHNRKLGMSMKVKAVST